MEHVFETNRLHWDEVTPIHEASAFYDVAAFRAGKLSLLLVEREEVGDVRGRRLLHLMCHFGLDTLSWSRLGADVTGIDFSTAAIATARRLALTQGLEGRFIKTNLYDLPDVLDGEFDIVYTSYGVLTWLPDLGEWARIVARYVKPGGFFYIVEGHPMGLALADEAGNDDLRLRYPYFGSPEPLLFEGDLDYADPAARLTYDRTYEFFHPLGEIVTSLIDAGLRIDFLHEFPFCAWRRLPEMQRGDDGYFYLPGNAGRVPFTFSIKASKPA